MKHVFSKLAVLCAVFTALNLSLFAQRSEWQWGRYGSGAYSDVGKCLTADAHDYIYVAGSFESAPFSFQQALNLNNSSPGVSREDIFIAKYDTLGNLIWAKAINGDYEDVVTGMKADEDGNLYLTGYFNSPTLTSGSLTITHGNTGYYEMFIAKFDSSGTGIWGERFTGTSGSTNNVKAFGIDLDSACNIYVTGMFECYYFNLQSVTLTNSSSGTYISDLFIAKFDSSGTIVWADGVGGGYSEMSYDVHVNSNGVYIAGYYSSSNVIFGNDTLPAFGSTNFIAKYNHAGNALWAQSINGSMPVSTGVTPANRPTICSDVNGNLYVTGVFNNTFVTFANDTIFHPASSEGYYVAKYDDFGNALWGKGGGGYPNGLRVAPTGTDFYLSLTGTLNYGSFSTMNETYVILCNSNGDTTATTYIDGTAGEIYDIMVDPNDELYATGHYHSADIYFSLTQMSPFYNYNGSYDFFVAKLQGNTGTGIGLERSVTQFRVYPNPAAEKIFVETNGAEKFTYQIINIAGEIVDEAVLQNNMIDISGLEAGLYCIQLTNNQGNKTVSKFTKQ